MPLLTNLNEDEKALLLAVAEGLVELDREVNCMSSDEEGRSKYGLHVRTRQELQDLLEKIRS